MKQNTKTHINRLAISNWILPLELSVVKSAEYSWLLLGQKKSFTDVTFGAQNL